MSSANIQELAALLIFLTMSALLWLFWGFEIAAVCGLAAIYVRQKEYV